MSYQKHLENLEATRQEKAARLEEVFGLSVEEGRSMDDAERDEYDTLKAEIKTLDSDIVRCKEMLETMANKAVTPSTPSSEQGSKAPHILNVRSVRDELEKGIGFARLAKVRALSRLDGESRSEIARRLYGENSSTFQQVIKAPVPAGTTTDATWAGPLVGDETSAFADFIEYLRPMTITGQFGSGGVPGFRRVPFYTALVGQTSGGSGYWVGEGKAKPLTKFDFERKSLTPLKVANIAVITEELLRDSSPSAEAIIRDSLAAALAERMDIDFIDPAKAAVAGVSPASILNGAPTAASAGVTADDVRADIRTLFDLFLAADNPPRSGVWVMSASTALALSLMQNPLGQAEFPGIGMSGGTLFGLPVITSEYMPTNTAGGIVALVNASDIYWADEGGVSVDMSREASLEMDDAPAHDSPTPTGASLVSMFQTNSVAFRAERTVNWMPRRTNSVAYLTGVNWG